MVKAIINGGSVKVSSPEDGFITRLTRVDVSSDSSSVHGQYPWRLGQIKVDEGYEFPTSVFWWLTIWSTTGSIPTSQWLVGEHSNRRRSLENATMEWIVDDCWTQTYTNDHFGNNLNGSLDRLVEAVLAGKRVRVKIDLSSYVAEADNLFIKDGHVSAQILGQYTIMDAYEFPTSVSWVWTSVSTTGHIRIVDYEIGSPKRRGANYGGEHMTWFVESRPWSRVLTTSSAGIATQGSKANLINTLKRGYSLRLVVCEEEDSVSVIEADNILIQNSEVSVQPIRCIADENGKVTIPMNPPVYWRFIMTSTDGNQRVVLWKAGEHSSLPATTEKYQVDWIVG